MKNAVFELSAKVGTTPCTLRGSAPLASSALRLTSRWQPAEGGRLLTATLSVTQKVTLCALRITLPFDLLSTDCIFLNGYQSWTDSIEQPVGTPMHGLRHVPRFLLKKYAFDRYGDYRFARYPDQHGFSYCYRRRGDSYLLAASLSERAGFTIFYPEERDGTLIIEKECRGLELLPGQEYDAFQLALLEGSEEAVFDEWFRLMKIAPPTAQPLWGYTSWYQHYQNISEPLVLDTLSKSPADWQVFQIDDGWEPAIGDWLTADEKKFPSGMKAMADAVRDKKMLAGLWLAPFAAQRDALLCAEHPDWLVRDEKGQPVLCGSNWGGFYALDFYHPAVRDHLRRVFDRVVRDWGYGLLKLDFLYAVCVLPRPDKTRGQIICEAMDFLRECAGDAMILACGVPLAAAFGKVDYCRIGTDVSLAYDDSAYMRLFHRERISTRYSLQNTVWRRQLSGRAFLNDPDVFLLRDNAQKMTWEQRAALATVNALFGALLFTSDEVCCYDTRQQAMLRRMRTLRESEISAIEQQGDLLHIRYTCNLCRYRIELNVKTGAFSNQPDTQPPQNQKSLQGEMAHPH